MAGRVAGPDDPAGARAPQRHFRRRRRGGLARFGGRAAHFRRHRPDILPAPPPRPMSEARGETAAQESRIIAPFHNPPKMVVLEGDASVSGS